MDNSEWVSKLFKRREKRKERVRVGMRYFDDMASVNLCKISRQLGNLPRSQIETLNQEKH